MCELVQDFIAQQARERPGSAALYHKTVEFDYASLQQEVDKVAAGFGAMGLAAGERIAIYLPKQPEFVFALFGGASAGLVFVPVNPLLKPAQVAYILADCGVKVLVTSRQRLDQLAEALDALESLQTVVLVDDETAPGQAFPYQVLAWPQFAGGDDGDHRGHARIDLDVAAILYTSGSTGKPKGVVLSHRNIVAGAHSVATYLGNTSDDRLLAVLPFSFDYGLSQLTTAFSRGASVVLMDYLLPRDVIRAVAKYSITGLAAVPPLWNQIAGLEWPDEARNSLRYITNSGGAMPLPTTRRLREALPNTDVVLMYGLTEAFRSTYLPASEVDSRPDSIGRAIPNAEILVVRPDGSICEDDEPGELVHRGALVAMGYWNDEAKTRERFRASPGQSPELPLTEVAVWSGDEVRRDAEGFLYFVSRKDEMIKTSGYRVSPTEVEEVVFGHDGILEAVALGLPHPMLGQGILLLVCADDRTDAALLLKYCQRELPNYMVPQAIERVADLPRNQNGKIDRKGLHDRYQEHFSE